MLRAAYLPRSQPSVLNFILVTKRWQKSSGAGTTTSAPSSAGSGKIQYPTSNPSSTYQTSTDTTRSSYDSSIDRKNNPLKSGTTPPVVPPYSQKPYTPPPPNYSRPMDTGSSGGGAGRIVKTIILGTALGLAGTLVYAECENGSFRRKLESTVPYSAEVLGGLDQVFDPMLGRRRISSTDAPHNYPDLAYVKDKVTEKDPLTKLTDQVKSTAHNIREKLPDKAQIQKAGEQVKDSVAHTLDPKKVKDAVHHATDQVKGAVHSATDQVKGAVHSASDQVKGAVHSASDQVKGAVSSVRDKLPDSASVKKNLAHAKEQVEDKAHAVKKTIVDAVPIAAAGQSGDPTGKTPDPVFREEAGEMILPPPIPEEKYKQLEQELSQLFSPLSKQLDDAVKASKDHISHMKTLIENPQITPSDHETWKKAEDLQENAKTAYEKVHDAVREWKNKLAEYAKAHGGKSHPDEKKLEEKYQELQKHYTTSSFVKNFRNYIDEATKSFQKEIETMFPSLAGKSPSQLTQEDLQALLVHAHRRVVKLQNDIARMRVNESDSVKAAIEVAKTDLDRVVEERVQKRVEKTTELLNAELQSYEKNLHQQFDDRLKTEIAIQYQALTQYLADVLSQQYQDWAREYEKQLETESIKINLRLQKELRETLNRLSAIEQAIEANYHSQVRGREAQQLWIQAQNLLNQIVRGTATEHDLDVLSKIAPNEKFVQVLVNELKSEDLSNTNEENLRERFSGVKKLCRRLALVNDDNNSLWTYFLSYLQSLFILRQRDDSILHDDAIDLNRLDTFAILNYVQSYLDHNQWYNALRLMQLLTGESRKAAQTWINDTRSYLAKKQTSQLLEAYSNSIGLGTLPKTS